MKVPGRHSLDDGVKSPAFSWGKYGPHRTGEPNGWNVGQEVLKEIGKLDHPS